MNEKDISTKTRLSNSFKELLLVHPFEKITIHMITDLAGVIRPTFYNYFSDKHAIFEWILKKELMEPLFALVENDMEQEAFKMIFHYFSKNHLFYRKAFQVTGQNGFEEILTNELQQLLTRIMKKHEISIDKEIKLLTREAISLFYSREIIMIIQSWVLSNDNVTNFDKAYEASLFLFTHSFLDIIKK